MNSLTISGNLTRDAEVKYLQNGDAVCSFSVADSEGRDKPTIFWNCSLFGKRAEGLSQYLTKGNKVTVVGRVSERSYTDKNGQEKKFMDVRVNDIALQGGGSRDEPVPAPRRAAVQSGGGGVADDDVPFAPIRGALLLAM
jgi:single-strand DNA-binding protein